jgi:hypothetical protein
MLLEHPYEGKWISCNSPEGNFACRTYFAVEQDGNVCKGDWYRVNPNERHVVMSLERKYGNRVYPVKHCSLDNKGFSNCNILEDGYDEHGRKTYKTSVPFSKWKDNRNEGERWMQGFYKKTFFSTSIKTPFLSGEREELIQTNKWLQDCLNYKGE